MTDRAQSVVESAQSCRSEEGITVLLVDALIGIMRVLAPRDLRPEPVQEALTDLLEDRDFRSLLDAAHTGEPDDEQTDDPKVGGYVPVSAEAMNDERLLAAERRADKARTRADQAEADRNRQRKYAVKAAQRLEAAEARAERAEAELSARYEADSADAAAGSYAHRAERAEQQATQWRHLATRRGQQLGQLAARADRYEAAWQSARLRAAHATRRAEYRLERLRIRRRHVRNLEQRAEQAEQRAENAEQRTGDFQGAMSYALGLGNGAPWHAIHARAIELRDAEQRAERAEPLTD